MKINHVETASLSLRAGEGALPVCLVTLSAGGDATGQGIGVGTTAPEVETLAESVLMGEDPRAIAAHWQRMQEGTAASNPGAAVALDMALWDLVARDRDEPLWRTLGGGETFGIACMDIADARIARHEVRAVRWSLRAGAAEHLRQLDASLAQFDSPPDLVLELPGQWAVDAAIEAVQAIEDERDVSAVRAPFEPWGAEGLARLSRRVAAVVCAEGLPHRVTGLFNALAPGTTDMLYLDPARHGISGVLEYADAAYGYEWPIMLGWGAGGVAAHLATALATVACIDVPADESDHPWVHGVTCRDGRVIPGDAPGHGIRVPEGEGSG